MLAEFFSFTNQIFSFYFSFGGWLVLGLGSSNGIITKECSLFSMVSSPLIAVTVGFVWSLHVPVPRPSSPPHASFIFQQPSISKIFTYWLVLCWLFWSVLLDSLVVCLSLSATIYYSMLSLYNVTKLYLCSSTFVFCCGSLMKLCKTFQSFAYRYFLSVFLLYGICSSSFITYFKLFCFKK